MMREVSVLGSTGSIGTSALDVIRHNRDVLKIIGMSCHTNISLFSEQIKEFCPQVVSVGPGKDKELKSMLSGMPKPPDILEGPIGLSQVATCVDKGIVIAALVGAIGIKPILAGINAGNSIALANKEALVMAGNILISEAKRNNVDILPIDSEHNAIFQCLRDESKTAVSFITLTASGGPFLNTPVEEFGEIKLQNALNHPNWEMGPKITIDSATLMNKCLEIIEAKWLFNLELEQIKVVVHPQSVIHSMVTFIDGSTMSQMGVPDMRTPISYCLGYPDRIPSGSAFLDLADVSPLTFFPPDTQKFPSLDLAFDVLELSGGAPAALNGANEILVDQFLNQTILFSDISNTLVTVVNKLKSVRQPSAKEDVGLSFLNEIHTIEDALAADEWGRQFALDILKNS